MHQLLIAKGANDWHSCQYWRLANTRSKHFVLKRLFTDFNEANILRSAKLKQ
jgi:hypothetical protein